MAAVVTFPMGTGRCLLACLPACGITLSFCSSYVVGLPLCHVEGSGGGKMSVVIEIVDAFVSRFEMVNAYVGICVCW